MIQILLKHRSRIAWRCRRCLAMLLVAALSLAPLHAGASALSTPQQQPDPPAGLSASEWQQIVEQIGQQAYLKASNTDEDDIFGRSVAIDGDTIVVGASEEDGNASGVNGDQSDNSASGAGAAYVFVRNGGVWSQQAYLKASNSAAGDGFGMSVDVNGDTIVVGASGEDGNASGVNGDQSDNSALTAGAAYVFVRSGTIWSQQAYLKASNSGTVDFFGSSVAISGDTIVVGAAGEDSNANGVDGDQSDDSADGAGAAYVFVRSGTTWSQQAYLKASNSGTEDFFGISVAIGGDTIVVGAFREDAPSRIPFGDPTEDSGAAYVFVRDPQPGGFVTWKQQQLLRASNLDAIDQFGTDVAIDANTIVVGTPYEESSAKGVNGDQGNNSAFGAGASYVFVRSGTTWTQQAYLKASNTDRGDRFGTSVAVRDNTVVVGAATEDSVSTDNQANNAASSAGAAYVFTRNGTTWSQQAYLKASNVSSSDAFGFSIGVDSDTIVVGAAFEDVDATGVNGDQTNHVNDDFNAGATYVFIIDDDNDGVANDRDNCPAVSNPDQTNTDGGNSGDACDPDDDNDGVLDGADNCPLVANPDQTNTDGGNSGDACDPDDDNDGILDGADNCPLVANPDQTNTDGGSSGDACDPDDDNDGILDGADNCPLVANADQADTDNNGVGDACSISTIFLPFVVR